MDCIECGYCEEHYECAFFPTEVYKLRWFKDTKIIKDGDYYYLGRCQYYVDKKCLIHEHDDKRPILCIIYPVRYTELGDVYVDTECPAHASVTQEELEYAKKIIPIHGVELARFIRENDKHISLSNSYVVCRHTRKRSDTA